NDNGLIVSWSKISGGATRAFSYTGVGGMQDLGTLTGGTYSEADGVNDNGLIVGRSTISGGATHAFSYTSTGGMQDLGTLTSGTYSQAYAVNDSGLIVGFGTVSGGGEHAFAYTSGGGMQDLGTLPGGTNSEAYGVNDSGVIVGYANTGGPEHAVMWVPVSDTTAPTTSITLSPTSPNGSNGWYRSSVGVTISANDPDDTVAQTRCVLDPTSAPSSYDDLPSGQCSLSSVSSDGTHTIYAASVDSNGNKETPVSVTFGIDQTKPSLTPTLSSATVLLNQTGVTASANATDSTSGVASSSCGAINAGTAGDHTVSCTATDNAGNSNSVTVHYMVQYSVLGFFSPAVKSKWKVGTTVPIKIALADVNGTRISDSLAASLATACTVTFSATGAQTLSGQCMKYDAATHQFIYNWKLASRAAGSETITVTVSYSGASTSTKTEGITVTV
ncbi:MAG: PxKF domain-containing protein, partial [Ilumatobacteraceae bacterium]